MTKNLLEIYLVMVSLFMLSLSIGIVKDYLGATKKNDVTKNFLASLSTPVKYACKDIADADKKFSCVKESVLHNNIITSDVFNALVSNFENSQAFKNPRLLALSFHNANHYVLLKSLVDFHRGILSENEKFRNMTVDDVDKIASGAFIYSVYTTAITWIAKIILTVFAFSFTLLLLTFQASKNRKNLTWRENNFSDAEVTLKNAFKVTIANKRNVKLTSIFVFSSIIIYSLFSPTITLLIY